MLQEMWREEIASSKLKARTALCHAAGKRIAALPFLMWLCHRATLFKFQRGTLNVELEQPLHPMADLVTGVFSDDLAVGQAEFFKGPLEDSGHAGAGFAPVQIHQP